ncbi:MAG: pitrilysin family protein [bacterium]
MIKRYCSAIYIFLFLLFVITCHVEAKVKQTVLENALSILTQEDHSQPLVAVQVWVRAGAVDEQDENNGVSHFLEHMLFKGTKTMGAADLARTIEANGGIINAATSKDFTYYHVVIPAEYYRTAVKLLGDIVTSATFPQEEVERERLVILEEIKRRYDNTQAYLWDIANQNLYKEHPYHRTVLGTSFSVSQLSRNALVDYYKRYYVPANMTFVLVGDFKTADALSNIRAVFKDREYKSPQKTEYEPVQPGALYFEQYRKTPHVHLWVGTLGPNIASEDQYALDVLTSILGGGRSSRLYRKLKEEEGLAHSISIMFLTVKGQGPIYVNATCDPEKTDQLQKRITEELFLMQKQAVTEEELKRAKTLIKSNFLFSKETFENQAFDLGYYQTISDHSFTESYIRKIESVTKEDIMRVSRTYIKKGKLAFTLIKPLPEEKE